MKHQSILLSLIILRTDHANAARRDGLGAPPPVSDHEETVSSQALNFMALDLERESIDRENSLDSPSSSSSNPELEYGFEREPIDRESLLKRSQLPSHNGREFERLREFNVADDEDEDHGPTLIEPGRNVQAVARRLRSLNESVVETKPKESFRDVNIPLVGCCCCCMLWVIFCVMNLYLTPNFNTIHFSFVPLPTRVVRLISCPTPNLPIK